MGVTHGPAGQHSFPISAKDRPTGAFGSATRGVGPRVLALVALAAAIAVVVVVLSSGGAPYTLKLYFQDASGLVTGDQVMIGPAAIGTVQSIGLAANASAEVVIALDSSATPMNQGTVARIYENSLAGIASKYVVLEPGPPQAPAIPSGGVLGEQHTYSNVSLDQLFNLFNKSVRRGLSGLVRGEAANLQGRASQARRTLLYLAPGLQSTSEVTRQLSLYEPSFDSLLTAGAQAMAQLGSRASELTQLIASTDATTAAIAGRGRALSSTLQLLPGALERSTSTFTGLRQTLDALTPLVDRSKPASRHLTVFASSLRTLSTRSIPTLQSLASLIAGAGGNLTTLLRGTPSLSRIAAAALPRLITSMNASQSQLNYLREYTPDVVAALTNLGQASGYYDANGHYIRSQPFFSAFTVNSMNQLAPLPAFENRYSGLHLAQGRCPGAAVQPSPDGSAPARVPGCNPLSVPTGP